MADRIMTLCEKCADEMKTGGMRIKQVQGKTATEKKKACEYCGNRAGGMIKQFIVSGKGR